MTNSGMKTHPMVRVASATTAKTNHPKRPLPTRRVLSFGRAAWQLGPCCSRHVGATLTKPRHHHERGHRDETMYSCRDINRRQALTVHVAAEGMPTPSWLIAVTVNEYG